MDEDKHDFEMVCLEHYAASVINPKVLFRITKGEGMDKKVVFEAPFDLFPKKIPDLVKIEKDIESFANELM